MKIAISADHRGFNLKKYLLGLTETNPSSIEWLDFGTDSDVRTDYPLFVTPVAEAVLNNEAEFGILICGSGIGMSIVANRFIGIRAALAWNKDVAKQAKEHDNANVLVLPADYIKDQEAITMIAAWLNSRFLEGRYETRLSMFE